jgi:hypothetical protein
MTPEQRICKGLELIGANNPYKYTKWKETTINMDSHSFIREMDLASFSYHPGLNENRIRKIKTTKLLIAGKIYLKKWEDEIPTQ